MAGNIQTGFDSVDNTLDKIAQATDSSPDSVKCLRALFITDPSIDRAKLITAKGELVDNSCDWITQKDEFVQWRDSDGGLLWISGGPGLGKTMLSIYLSEYLQSYFSSTEDKQHYYSTYFFCDLKENTRNNAVAIARGLLFQLLEQREELIKYILPTYQIQKDRLFQQTSFEALWKIFLEMINNIGTSKMFCILDGLDECEPASLEQLLVKLSKITTTSPRLKIIVLSREYPHCLEASLNQFHRIRLDPDAKTEVSNGLNEYISTRVAELSMSKQYPAELANHVKAILRKKSAGTYLWVSFVVKDLQNVDIPDVEATLDQFPRGLDALYERILHQVEYSRGELILNILRWCTLSVRPLTLNELVTVLQIQPTQFSDEKTVLRGKLAYCGHFLNIADDAVTLVHQSAYDFLTRHIPQSQTKSWFSLSCIESENSTLASVCISYIQNGCLEYFNRQRSDTTWASSDSLQYGFFDYAERYWTTHFRSSGQYSVEVIDENEDFFSRKSQCLSLWMQWKRETYNGIEFVAAQFDLTTLMQRILDEDGIWRYMKEAFARAPRRTPLHLAAENGHLPIVQLLINKGTRINIKDKYGDTPLHAAARNGHLIVVDMLIANKARIDIQDKYGDTPLHDAARSGHLSIVETLIKNKANIESENNRGDTPLCAAITDRGDNIQVVEYLLQCGANVNGATSGSSPLVRAVEELEPEIVQQLLGKGADAYIQDEYGKPLLEIAMETYSSSAKQISLVLLEYWAERFCIEPSKFQDMAVFPSGSTALHGACRQGNVSAIRLLLNLKWRLDLNQKDGEGDTALHAAIDTRKVEIVELLVSQPGVDPSVVNRWGCNALHLALIHGQAAVVQYLVKERNMSLPLTEENNSWAAIHLVSLGWDYRSGGDVAVTETLRCIVNELEADPQLRTFEPRSRGVDWHSHHSQDKYRHPDFDPYWRYFSYPQLIPPDFCSETPLSLAIQRGCIEAVRYFLVDCKIDPNSPCRGCDGASPLHVAAQSARDGIIEYLVSEWNVNVNCLDSYQRTPLHLVAFKVKISYDGLIFLQIRSYPRSVDCWRGNHFKG